MLKPKILALKKNKTHKNKIKKKNKRPKTLKDRNFEEQEIIFQNQDDAEKN